MNEDVQRYKIFLFDILYDEDKVTLWMKEKRPEFGNRNAIQTILDDDADLVILLIHQTLLTRPKYQGF